MTDEFDCPECGSELIECISKANDELQQWCCSDCDYEWYVGLIDEYDFEWEV